jgi:ribose 5-phosphate isomerase B
MRIALGCDHGGYSLKGRIRAAIETAGHVVVDCGAYEEDPSDDYPDFARQVGEALLAGRAERGILVCGSGVGAAIAATKIPGIRAGLCHDSFSARQGVEDDAMNVLCLGARVIGPELAAELVGHFLRATFSEAERHLRRLRKISEIQREAAAGRFDMETPISPD